MGSDDTVEAEGLRELEHIRIFHELLMAEGKDVEGGLAGSVEGTMALQVCVHEVQGSAHIAVSNVSVNP